MLSGAIFDLDGTVLDSMFIWDTIAEDYLRSLGKKPRENLTQTFISFTMEEAAEYYRSNYDVPLSVKQIIGGINAMTEDIYRTKVTLKSGVKEYLYFLKEKGVKMCIATASRRRTTEDVLKRLGVLSCFSGIFTCDDVGCGKHSPVIYQRSLAFLGTKKEETLVFEDSLFALKTAKADGFKVVGVFDEHEAKQEELRRVADFYIMDFSDPVLRSL